MIFATIRDAAVRVAWTAGRAGAKSLRTYLENTADVDSLPAVESLPPGVVLDLPERGRTHVLDIAGPTPDAPTILLLHAIATTGYLTWFPVVDRLSQSHRVVLLDQRWHGQGICADRYLLEDCADDAAAVLQLLGISEAVVAGYSMGGATAQLVWDRHPELVRGLVLCSTSSKWSSNRTTAAFYSLLGGLNRTVLNNAAAHIQTHQDRQALHDAEVTDIMGWCVRELRRTSVWALPGALHALGTFDSTGWLPGVDVPAAVVITTKDRAIGTTQQYALAALIPAVRLYEVVGGHTSLMFARDAWQPAFFDAVADVTAAVDGAKRPDRRVTVSYART